MSRSNCLIAWLLQAGLAAVFLAVMAPGASAATFSAGVSQSGADVGVCTTAPGGQGRAARFRRIRPASATEPVEQRRAPLLVMSGRRPTVWISAMGISRLQQAPF